MATARTAAVAFCPLATDFAVDGDRVAPDFRVAAPAAALVRPRVAVAVWRAGFFAAFRTGLCGARDAAFAGLAVDFFAGLRIGFDDLRGFAATFFRADALLLAALAAPLRTGFAAAFFFPFGAAFFVARFAVDFAGFFAPFVARELFAFVRATRRLLDPAGTCPASPVFTTSRDDSGFPH
ncbi:MAG: hypothetical protein AB7G12_01200 [Thermoanaerobaculia bacterium]